MIAILRYFPGCSNCTLLELKRLYVLPGVSGTGFKLYLTGIETQSAYAVRSDVESFKLYLTGIETIKNKSGFDLAHVQIVPYWN